MADKVSTDAIAAAIQDALTTYSNDVQQRINKAVDVRSKELLDKVMADSPKRTGDYAKNWKLRKNEDTRIRYSKILYNKDTYRLTHLLEHGHADRSGTKRTKAYPHIKDTADITEKKFLQDVTKAIEEAGKG